MSLSVPLHTENSVTIGGKIHLSWCQNEAMSSNEPKKRLKAAESRRALLDAGLELLKSRGVAPGLDRVTLKEAIEVSGVPRSTAYRLYEGGRGQLEEFRADLLSDLDNSIDSEPTKVAITRVLDEVAPLIESKDPTKLAAALREVIRGAMHTNMDSVVESVEWRVYMSSLASLGTGADADPMQTEMFREAAYAFGERYAEFLAYLASTFGLRVREPLTLSDVGLSISAIIEGVALRQHVDPRLANLKRPTGPNGEMQSWNAAAVAVESVVLSLTEPDPDADVSADLSSWIS